MAWSDRVLGILKTGGITVAVVVSLLVFPSGLLWMIAFWLALFTVARVRGRSGWLPLVVCLAVLMVKRPDWSPGLIALALLMASAILLPIMLRDASNRTSLITWGLAGMILWACWGVSLLESRASTLSSRPLQLEDNRPVVCLGNSVTTGLMDQEAYPLYLQRLITVPVINMGRAGITAEDALRQLPALVEANPQVVVVELGGHDYLRQYGREATRKSLIHIITACQNLGAEVILVEIPRGFITDEFSGLERELARKYDLELMPDTTIRLFVLRSPTLPLGNLLGKPLSDDGLHPNIAGAKHLAQEVAEVLKQMYGPEILRRIE